jgi:hypothetical protein
MTGLKAKITKIHEPKLSYNGDVAYIRINLQLEDGSFAQTDIVPKYRNYAWWQPVLKAGIGTWIGGVFLKQNGKVDADSRVEIIKPPLHNEQATLGV